MLLETPKSDDASSLSPQMGLTECRSKARLRSKSKSKLAPRDTIIVVVRAGAQGSLRHGTVSVREIHVESKASPIYMPMYR